MGGSDLVHEKLQFDCVLREHKKTKHGKKKNLNYLDELNSTARFSLYHLRTLADIFFCVIYQLMYG